MILPRDTTVLPLSTFAYDLLLPEHTIRYDILYISRLYTHVVLVAFYEGGSSTSSQGPPINGASSVLKCFLHLRRTRSVQPYDTTTLPIYPWSTLPNLNLHLRCPSLISSIKLLAWTFRATTGKAHPQHLSDGGVLPIIAAPASVAKSSGPRL